MKTHRIALAALILSLIAPYISPLTLAQTATQTVTITGHVLDVGSNLYLKNAEVRIAGTETVVFTGDDGSYSIEVPAGSVTLTASYINTRSATRTLDARPGTRNTIEFELQPLLAIRKPGEDVVQLERFTVTEERVGQAKVYMEQRAADNAKTVISTDQFGELTQGSVGEFMKYMPGVTLDYSEDEAETVRVGGLDPKYAGFSMDGISLASATENNSRANTFRQMSITAIESIEFNQTLLARMPANTPAGKFELKTRYAFNRKKPEISFDIGLDGISDAIELGRDYMPDNKKHYRTYPGGRISYGGAFLKRRLGIEASVSRYANYRNNQWQQTQYSYLVPPHVALNTNEFRNPNPGTTFVTRNGNLEMEEGPVIRQLAWRDGPRIWTSSAASLSLDYKITPNLIFALRSNISYNENEYFNIYYRMTAEDHDSASPGYTGPPTGFHQSSNLTYWKIDPSDPRSLETFIYESNSYRVETYENYLISPRLTYKKGPLEVEFRGGYSSAYTNYGDGDQGRFRGAPDRISGIGWEATRPSTDSPSWTLKQTAGTLWSEHQNWGRTQTYLMGIYYDNPSYAKNIQTSGYLDLTYALRVFNHPVTMRAGGSVLNSDWSKRRDQKNFNYVGPEGLQLASILPYASNYSVNIDLGGKSGNINQQNWPVIDQSALWQLYQTHPEWFQVDTVDNIKNAIVNTKSVEERIDGAYFEATTRVGRFNFNVGIRGERTTIDVMTVKMRTKEDLAQLKSLATPEEVATGMFDPATPTGMRYQYYNGERTPRTNSYDNIFLSGGLKYDFTKNLRLQISFSQAILRPDYDNLAGTLTYPDYYPTNLWIPNPLLKPEKTTKYYAGLQWYLNPAGIISISAYRLDIDDLQIKNMQITEDQAKAQMGGDIRDYMTLRWYYESSGDNVDGELAEALTQNFVRQNAINYRSTVNADGTRSVYGVTLEYNQQLTFLPGMFKGLSLFGSFTTASLTNAQIDEEKIGRASKSANGGIKYRYGRFNVQLRGTWTDDALSAITRPIPGRRWMQDDHIYNKARLIVDLSGGFRINSNLELVFSIRNITNSPLERYSNVPDRLYQYQVYGSTWNLSLRGKY